MANSPIAVIGAGVTGLTTALKLQHTDPSTPIYLLAAELPTDAIPSPDYASAWAGAHYRPIPAGSNPQLAYEAKLARRTAGVMLEIADKYAESEAGVGRMKALEFLEIPPEENLVLKTGDVYAFEGDGFRVLDQHELPKGMRWGCEYNTYCVNVPVYLRWMLERFVKGGGVVLRRRLSSSEEVFDVLRRERGVRVSTEVNCSGRNFYIFNYM